jgi:carbamoyl-phosphate synthase large subunit
MDIGIQGQFVPRRDWLSRAVSLTRSWGGVLSTNILISSAGRRIGLLESFRESLSGLGLSGRVIAVDATEYSAAGEAADEFYLVPKCSDPTFIPQILEICNAEKIDLIVPTIDTELSYYAAARGTFKEAGTIVAVSDPTTIALCEDKVFTHEWLVAHGFPAPRQSTPLEVLENPNLWEFPIVVKPRNGSASSGVRVIESAGDLQSVSRNASLILQEFVRGQEFTVNVFIDRQGRCVCVIPHRRMEVRGGEVSKGITVRHEPMMYLVRTLIEALPGAFGALNVQCFLTPDDEIQIIEINARFGGGYPLAHRAGATISRWLLEDSLDMVLSGPFDTWQEGLVMLRYDQPIFIEPGESRCRVKENVASLYRF